MAQMCRHATQRAESPHIVYVCGMVRYETYMHYGMRADKMQARLCVHPINMPLYQCIHQRIHVIIVDVQERSVYKCQTCHVAPRITQETMHKINRCVWPRGAAPLAWWS